MSVISIRGGVFKDCAKPPAEPHPGTIEALEQLLERAKAGEIIGFRMAALAADGLPRGTMVGYSNYAMLGMLHSLAHDLSDELSGDDD